MVSRVLGAPPVANQDVTNPRALARTVCGVVVECSMSAWCPLPSDEMMRRQALGNGVQGGVRCQ